MKDYCKLDEATADKMDTIGCRLFTLRNGLNLLLYCMEGEIYSENASEIHSFGLILHEYFLKTKNMYNEIEEEVGTLN